MNKRGVTLVETLIAISILVAALLPLVSIFIYGTRATVNIAKANIAMELARELMDEIKSKHWDEWNAKDRWNAEKAVPEGERNRVGRVTDTERDENDRATYDDIDDYDDWDSGPGEDDAPADVNGHLYNGEFGRPDYRDYRRRVKVRYVEGGDSNPDNLKELPRTAAGRGATNGKQVAVIVSWGGDKKKDYKVITTCILANYTREIEVAEQ